MTKADKEGQRKAPILRFKGFTNDWEQRQLREISSSTIGGGTPKSSNKKFWNGNIPWIQSSDLVNGDIWNIIIKKHITLDAVENSAAKIISANSIAVVTRVAVGKLVYMPLEYATSQDFISFQNLSGDHSFFMYLVSKVMHKVKGSLQGTSIKGISKGELLKKKVIYTLNIKEQKKIGTLLKSLDTILTLYAKKSSCLDSCIAYFIRILYDDPQFFKQKNVQNSIIKSFKLDDILIKNNAKNKDLSILNVESISNKKGFISQKEQFDNYRVASKDLSNYYVIRPKDFAYNPSRINVGSIAYKNPNEIKGIVSPLYVSFKCNNDIVLDKYLWYWFKSTNFEHQRVRLSEGGVRDTLSFNQLSKMKISIPSFEIQRQTINLLEILIQYKEEVDLKLNNLKLIKNTLLQNMFL